jgi:Cu+-exporting ATPase
VDTVVFDKTGTLTKGEPEVTDIITLGAFQAQELLRLAGSAEKRSEHPLGEAVLRKAREQSDEVGEPREFQALEGLGV